MRQEPDFFGEDEELSLLYIAKKLREAKKIEEKLSAADIDYLVEPDKYRGGLIFVSERIGAFFYVPPESLDSARAVLREAGYRPFEAANP